jgi:hypothetical protein
MLLEVKSEDVNNSVQTRKQAECCGVSFQRTLNYQAEGTTEEMRI